MITVKIINWLDRNVRNCRYVLNVGLLLLLLYAGIAATAYAR